MSLSPNPTVYPKFVGHFILIVKYILPLSSFSERSIREYINVHYHLWLSFRFTDTPSKQTFNFTILIELEQFVPRIIHIPYRRGDQPNIIGLCLTTQLSAYAA